MMNDYKLFYLEILLLKLYNFIYLFLNYIKNKSYYSSLFTFINFITYIKFQLIFNILSFILY